MPRPMLAMLAPLLAGLVPFRIRAATLTVLPGAPAGTPALTNETNMLFFRARNP